jgi:hypothetical protein
MKHAYVCCHLWNGSIKWHSPTWLSPNKYMACNPAILFKKITQNETIIHQPKYFAMKNVDLATKQEYISNVLLRKSQKNRPAYPINWQIVGGNRTCSWCVGWSSVQGRFPGKYGRFGRLVSRPKWTNRLFHTTAVHRWGLRMKTGNLTGPRRCQTKKKELRALLGGLGPLSWFDQI